MLNSRDFPFRLPHSTAPSKGMFCGSHSYSLHRCNPLQSHQIRWAVIISDGPSGHTLCKLYVDLSAWNNFGNALYFSINAIWTNETGKWHKFLTLNSFVGLLGMLRRWAHSRSWHIPFCMPCDTNRKLDAILVVKVAVHRDEWKKNAHFPLNHWI